jgi:nucleotide-binding universal stress UspA family protein
MFNTILVAVDGSTHAIKALDAASDLAGRYAADLIVLSVYRHHSPLESTHSMVRGAEEIDPPDRTLARLAREIVNAAVERAKGQGAQVRDGLVKRGPPARTIVRTAEEQKVDAIVMGSRGLGDLEGHLLGSVSHKVTSLAKCTCITVK